MTEKKQDEKKKLSLSGKKTLSLKAPVGAAQPTRQHVSSGRVSKSVEVEVRRKRGAEAQAAKAAEQASALNLTDSEREARERALQQAQAAPRESSAPVFQTKLVVKTPPAEEIKKPAVEKADPAKQSTTLSADDLRAQELAKMQQIQESERAKAEEAERLRKKELEKQRMAGGGADSAAAPASTPGAAPGYRMASGRRGAAQDDEQAGNRRRRGALRGGESFNSRLTVNQVINETHENREMRGRSMAAQRRAREKERMRQLQAQAEKVKQVRDVQIPEVITVQELANRMAERVGDVVKKLMETGVMATATQSIDADTAELIVHEFGHNVKRVSESDIEADLTGDDDTPESLKERPPVVTIMGHVDHGKTSLLDAIRAADVATGEAGGITQHIGAYQIETKSGRKITFIDTPGHAAFTEMRARGADVTDIVVLVVAANDSVMPQTVEAIRHAKAANKPIVVAINKCDLPTANPQKVKNELLQHDVIVEEMGGDSPCVEVSAKARVGLEDLIEMILLQAEVLSLKANPDRKGVGAVIEARLEQGKGSVATILMQKGTLYVGDVFVSGTQWGKIKTLHDDRGNNLKHAIPGQPIEVQGLNGTPEAGDDFVVVEDESKARAVSEFRERTKRAKAAAKSSRRSIDELIADFKEGTAKELGVIIKGDVHGSIEAIAASLRKLTEDNNEVKVNVLHAAVGAITESDVVLANASKALIIGFNVRANAQARDLAKREGVEIRYYSIIYQAIDDVKDMLGGLLSPEVSEKFIGYAEIRQIFNMSKYGKVAGCYVTEGMVKRGAKVRLLRDNVVIHEGVLKTLRRFKDEVREVQKGLECGMAFESYDDIKEGDVIEAFEVVEKARSLDGVA